MPDGDKKEEYYSKGIEEEASETLLTLKKLEKRRNLTRNSERLVIVLVGLPARGKSFISRKLHSFLNWGRHECKIFNVGRYRRNVVPATNANADFFDSKNEEATRLRQEAATLALQDMLRWLDGEYSHSGNSVSSQHGGSDDGAGHHKTDTESTGSPGSSTNHMHSPPLGSSRRTTGSVDRNHKDRIAIYDATNSTNERRAWILEECTSPKKRQGKPTGVVFVESICDDEELLRQNYKFKVNSSPDFEGMTEEEALEDLRKRVSKYEDQYETITDDSQSYIKIYNLSSKVLVNHIYGRMAKVIVPAIMAWNVGTRPVFLCRPGQTPHNEHTDEEDYFCLDDFTLDASGSRRSRVKGEKLGPTGMKFREALREFCAAEGTAFIRKQLEIENEFHPSLCTGTSQTGLSSYRNEVGSDEELPFPFTIFTSTMPRAADTVTWEGSNFPVSMKSSLNPLDKGDFCGIELEDIAAIEPNWYARLLRDAYCTRFPGGESYRDLIGRLDTVIIDIEQQLAPTMVVSHVSVLQALISYFRQSPVDECMSIEVPMHTVIKFTPSRGGGWMESRHELLPPEDEDIPPPPETIIKNASSGDLDMPTIISASELSALSYSDHLHSSQDKLPLTPIWGDKVKKHRRGASAPIITSTEPITLPPLS